MFSIRNESTGETAMLDPAAVAAFPAWAPAQCGVASEAALRALLQRMDVAEHLRAHGERADARGIAVAVPNGALAWKRADPFQGARWLFDEADVIEALDLDPELIVRLREDATA